jgi:CRP-like cAMP-binding protein
MNGVRQASGRRKRTPRANGRGRPTLPEENLLLAELPAAEFSRVRRLLDSVSPRTKTVLQKPGEPVHYVYFPCHGFLSVLMVMADGETVEVATIGREGTTGTTVAPGGRCALSLTIVQADMQICYRMRATAYRREMARQGPFCDVITRYGQGMTSALMQFSACNAVHTVEQRMARWLLMAQDRVGSDDFPLTQASVSMMLGAARQTVTVVAGTLQKAGLIRYRHGRVVIVDRPALEAASCECYVASTAFFQWPAHARKIQ